MFWDAETGTFHNPGHGEDVSMTGTVLSGPAPRGLWECPLEERGDEVWIRATSGANAVTIIAPCKASS
jgi:Rieske Fe-S protein